MKTGAMILTKDGSISLLSFSPSPPPDHQAATTEDCGHEEGSEQGAGS